jgi:hypothetical protein
MKRIGASLLCTCLAFSCGPSKGSEKTDPFVYLVFFYRYIPCTNPQMYRSQTRCYIPGSVPFIYNQSTTAYAGTTVTGVVALECRTFTSCWAKGAGSNPAPGTELSYISSNLVLSSYSIGDTLFCINSDQGSYHKVTIL